MSVKGLDDFIAVVQILSNPEKYTEKVNELKALIANYTEAIEAVVKLADVNDYTENIRVREAQSKAELEAARIEAADIKRKAKEYEDASKKAIKEKQLALTLAEKSLDETSMKVRERETECEKESENLRKEYNKFQADKLAFEEEQRVFADKVKKLTEAMK